MTGHAVRSLSLIFALAVGVRGQSDTPPVGDIPWQARWDDYVERTYGWKNVGMVALDSAVEQSFQLNKCGRPPYCLPHHVGGSLVRRTARTSVELGFGALLKEDLVRRPSNLPGFRQRVWFALTHAALARGPDGEWRPAYSRYIGSLAAVTVSSSWNGRALTTGRIGSSFGWTASSYFQDSLLSEFEPDLTRMGRRFWVKVRGEMGRQFSRF
jgi:hypothetical protein